jgi:hypothetical protein
MKSARKRPAAAKLRSWCISIIRKRWQYLGTVDAPNEKAAEAAAVPETATTAGRAAATTTRPFGARLALDAGDRVGRGRTATECVYPRLLGKACQTPIPLELLMLATTFTCTAPAGHEG